MDLLRLFLRRVYVQRGRLSSERGIIRRGHATQGGPVHLWRRGFSAAARTRTARLTVGRQGDGAAAAGRAGLRARNRRRLRWAGRLSVPAGPAGMVVGHRVLDLLDKKGAWHLGRSLSSQNAIGRFVFFLVGSRARGLPTFALHFPPASRRVASATTTPWLPGRRSAIPPPVLPPRPCGRGGGALRLRTRENLHASRMIALRLFASSGALSLSAPAPSPLPLFPIQHVMFSGARWLRGTLRESRAVSRTGTNFVCRTSADPLRCRRPFSPLGDVSMAWRCGRPPLFPSAPPLSAGDDSRCFQAAGFGVLVSLAPSFVFACPTICR